MKEINHSAANEIISEFLGSKNMTISKALETIYECADYDQDENVARDWERAMSYIAYQLGVVFDEDTEQWVTADEGHPV